MSHPRAVFDKDHEAVVQKFADLLKDATSIGNEVENNQGGARTELISRIFAARTSALNLLARTAGETSIYFRHLHDTHTAGEVTGFTPGIMIGILKAAMTDFREGFMADAKLLVSVRKSRGRDIRAACGQLLVETPRPSPAQRLATLAFKNS